MSQDCRPDCECKGGTPPLCSCGCGAGRCTVREVILGISRRCELSVDHKGECEVTLDPCDLPG